MLKSIPTKYNGIEFRSRLEARWASMFDQLGWHYDYEPLDFAGWCPDFMLTPKAEPPPRSPEKYWQKMPSILVEIKPAPEYFTPFKYRQAVAGTPYARNPILYLPPLLQSPPLEYRDDGWRLGWLDAPTFFGGPGYCPRCIEDVDGAVMNNAFGYGFIQDTGAWNDFMTGMYEGNNLVSIADPADVKALWREAGNNVQWNSVRTMAFLRDQERQNGEG